jgi:hypothetical protein
MFNKSLTELKFLKSPPVVLKHDQIGEENNRKKSFSAFSKSNSLFT